MKKFYEDPTLVLFGEDVRDWGGSYAVTRGFTEALPYHRFFNTAIAEAGIVGRGDRLRDERRPGGGGDHVL